MFKKRRERKEGKKTANQASQSITDLHLYNNNNQVCHLNLDIFYVFPSFGLVAEAVTQFKWRRSIWPLLVFERSLLWNLAGWFSVRTFKRSGRVNFWRIFVLLTEKEELAQRSTRGRYRFFIFVSFLLFFTSGIYWVVLILKNVILIVKLSKLSLYLSSSASVHAYISYFFVKRKFYF